MTRERLQQAAKMGEIRERLDIGEPISLDDQNWLFSVVDTVYNETHRLRAALRKYGHPYDCPASAQGTDGSGPCDCGLTEALKGDAPGLKMDAPADSPTAA